MKTANSKYDIEIYNRLDQDDLDALCRLVKLLDRWDRDAKITNKYKNTLNPEVQEGVKKWKTGLLQK